MPDTREQIAEAAAKATKQSGLKSVSFRDLAEQVGVKSSSVHYHFPTKPDLARALVLDYTEQLEANLRRIDNTEKSVSGKVQALVDVFEAVLRKDELCLCGMMASELTNLDDATKIALGEFFRTIESWLDKTLADSKADIAGLSTGELASLFLSGLEGAILVDRVDQSVERLSAIRQLAKGV